MSPGEVFLFSQRWLSQFLEERRREMLAAINRIDSNRLLNTNPADLADYFERSYRLEPPRLKEDQIQLHHDEVRVNMSWDRSRNDPIGGGPVVAEGTQLTFYVPFNGDAELFKWTPSRYSSIFPEAEVGHGELILRFVFTKHDVDRIRSQLNERLALIRGYLEDVARDVTEFNERLRKQAGERIEARRQKLLRDKGLVEALGFPLKRRPGAPATYTVPLARKRIVPRLPEPSSQPFAPEPTLDMGDYENILSIIEQMAMVMERSPRAFREMNEEDLRQHFLVQLNAQYEGQATGETFNFKGKSDILIRVKGRNIFIAECKFWSGQKGLQQAIDQLLGYASWRDTKTALLIFHRGKDFSGVLKKIPQTVKQHPNFKREVPLSQGSETKFRFVLGHPDDANRDLILTVLAFPVPR